ncbi:hypothetical protein, partial [Achromobacter ruhlandii]|uniref:hypothetical protein n=1 Tax=Achromobacter ruhlandii TaxID=72557 RepID=UPI001B8B4FC0
MPDRRLGWLAWLLWLALSCLSLPARGQDAQPVIDLSTLGGTLPLVGELRGIEDKAADQQASQVLDLSLISPPPRPPRLRCRSRWSPSRYNRAITSPRSSSVSVCDSSVRSTSFVS